MQWKIVTTMQSTSAQKRNNWGTQMTTLGCKHNAKCTQERERKKTLRRKQEMKCTLWCSETETEGKTKLSIGRQRLP